MDKGMWKTLEGSYDETWERLPSMLSAEGFGIVTQIDMQQTLKAKIGVDVARYRIVGACNPRFAHEALQRNPHVGLLLPCNVVLYEQADGKTVLGIIDPMQVMGADPSFADLAKEVAARLERVLASAK